MSVKIRLRRMGRKKQPHYRVVVADTASPRDGRFVESLGYYRPLTEPARLVLDLERVDYWLEKGALPSPTVKTLVSKARKGGDEDLAFGVIDPEVEKAKKAEALAARRQAEKDAAKAAEAEAKEAEAAKAKAEAEEAAKAKAEADETAKAEAEADESAEAEAPEEPADEAPEAKTEKAPDAKAKKAPAAKKAEAEDAAESEADEAPEADAEASSDEEKKGEG